MAWAWTHLVVLKDLVLAQFSSRDLHCASAVAVVVSMTRLKFVNFFDNGKDGPLMNYNICMTFLRYKQFTISSLN